MALSYVKVTFDGTVDAKAYTYRTDLALLVGDYAVVDSPSGLKVVNVIETDAIPYRKGECKFIVCKVNLAEHQAREM